MAISRRQVLSGGAAAGVGLTVAGALPSLAAPAAAHDSYRPGGRSGGRPFPPLQEDPNGILALPAGFDYTIVTREGVTDLSAGQGKTPAYHDGTGVVAADRNRLTIVQNHEVTPHMSTYACRISPPPSTTMERPTPAAARSSPPTATASAPPNGWASRAPSATAPAANDTRFSCQPLPKG